MANNALKFSHYYRNAIDGPMAHRVSYVSDVGNFIFSDMGKMADHGNGIAHVPAHVNTTWFHTYVLGVAHAMAFIPDNGNCRLVIAYGAKNAAWLRREYPTATSCGRMRKKRAKRVVQRGLPGQHDWVSGEIVT